MIIVVRKQMLIIPEFIIKKPIILNNFE